MLDIDRIYGEGKGRTMIKTYRLTVDDVMQSGSELPDKVDRIMTAEGNLDILILAFRQMEKTPYRLRLVEIQKEETHQTLEFRRAVSDNPLKLR